MTTTCVILFDPAGSKFARNGVDQTSGNAHSVPEVLEAMRRLDPDLMLLYPSPGVSLNNRGPMDSILNLEPDYRAIGSLQLVGALQIALIRVRDRKANTQ